VSNSGLQSSRNARAAEAEDSNSDSLEFFPSDWSAPRSPTDELEKIKKFLATFQFKKEQEGEHMESDDEKIKEEVAEVKIKEETAEIVKIKEEVFDAVIK